jgi:hypothetical protein
MHFYVFAAILRNMANPPTPADSDQATLEAATRMLEPLAGLMLARGIRYARVEELLKAAFVQAASRAYAAQGKLPSVSALSVATGLRRREVQRLTESTPLAATADGISLAQRIHARWLSDQKYTDMQGRPRRLARTALPGEASFETLAKEVSKDVHPRPLLDELLRIGVAKEDGDFVQLCIGTAPSDAAWDSLVTIGSSNAADHLSAVLVNLLNKPALLFEQAVFADGLTQQSAQRTTGLARELWQSAAPELFRKLQTLVDLDEAAPDNGWRMRIGLFSYMAPMDQPEVQVRTRSKRTPSSTKAKPVKEKKT